MRLLHALIPVVSALALLLVPGAASGAVRKHSHVIVKSIVIRQLPGPPPYVALDQQSRGPGFEIDVVYRNVGNLRSDAHRSLHIELDQAGQRVYHGRGDIPQLDPGQQKLETWEIPALTLDPGFLNPVAYFTVRGVPASRLSPRAGRRIPVVPREWTVSAFQADVALPNFLTGSTHVGNAFHYRLLKFDEAKGKFRYVASGPIITTAGFHLGDCNGSKSATDTKDPWPGVTSELRVDADLSHYTAGVFTEDEPSVNFTAKCKDGAQIPFSEPWLDLLTTSNGSDTIAMTPEDRSLTGSGKKVTPLGTASFSWSFVARISGA